MKEYIRQPKKREKIKDCSEMDVRTRFKGCHHPRLCAGLLICMTAAMFLIYSTSLWIDQRDHRLLVSSGILAQSRARKTRRYAVFNAREHHIEEVCNKSMPGKQSRREIKKTKRTDQMYFDDAHNVSFCVIAKAGCSFWRRALIVVSGALPSAQSPYDISPSRIHLVKHKPMSPVPKNRLIISFIFVRNPWSRLYSGYIDKVIGLQLDMIGFSRFRSDVMRFHKYSNNFSTNPDCTMDKPFTFREFVQFVTYRTKHGPNVDHHFAPMHPRCLPCQFKYDFIGKLETFYEDAQYILKILDLQNIFSSSVDANEQKEEDDIRYAAEMAIVNRQNKKGCVTDAKVYSAMWTTLMMHGLIHKDTPQPDIIKRGQGSANSINASQIIQIIKTARDKYGADAKARKRSKIELVRGDFLSFTLAEIADFYDAFKLDFQLFNYSKLPPIVGKYL